MDLVGNIKFSVANVGEHIAGKSDIIRSFNVSSELDEVIEHIASKFNIVRLLDLETLA